MNDPNMHARGTLQWQNHPELGRIVVQHSPLRFAGVPLAALVPSRNLGQDTFAVLRDRLSWDVQRVARMVGATKATRN